MEARGSLRNQMTLYTAVLYLLPVMLIAGYALFYLSLQQAWLLFLVGLVLFSIAGVVQLIKIWQWDRWHLERQGQQHQFQGTRQHSYSQEEGSLIDEDDYSIEAPDNKFAEQLEQLEAERHARQELEQELATARTKLDEEKQNSFSLEQQLGQIKEEFGFFQERSREQLTEKDQQIADYVEQVAELKRKVDTKQQKISKLNTAVNDLTYEVKTLLQISDFDKEEEPAPPVEPPAPEGKFVQASLFNTPTQKTAKKASTPSVAKSTNPYLRRCLDIAQKITGASHFDLSQRFSRSSGTSSTLDQRRLFDRLSSESDQLVVVFSPGEEKLLFANQKSKEWLGWSPDRFMQDFATLFAEGEDSWRHAVHTLSGSESKHATLSLKSRSGSPSSFQVSLGLIPTGLFKGHGIAVFIKN